MKRKYIFSIIIIFAVIVGYFLTKEVYPKNAGRYPAFVVLFLMEFYLWIKIKKSFSKTSEPTISLFAVIHWLPLSALAISLIVGYFIPSTEWSRSITTNLYGLIFSFYATKIIVALLFLISDIIHLIFKLFSSTIKKQKIVSNIIFAIGGIILITMLLGMYLWAHQFKVHQVEVEIAELPEVFDNYRIVQLSDMHLGSWSDKKSLIKAVEKINELNPDLIVFTGDFVNFRTNEAYPFISVLSQFKARDCIFCVLGNHDYGDYSNWKSPEEKQKNLDDLHHFYNELGWKLLRNENAVISKDSSEIALIGVENWGNNLRFPQYGDAKKASRGIENYPVKILLSHDPSYWKEHIINEFQDIDLTLSGHTHGFQFGLEIPTLGIKWSPSQYIYKEWGGLYENKETNQKLYVNRGLGGVAYSGRIGILPEITEITLKKP